jgi:hypothetical protein
VAEQTCSVAGYNAQRGDIEENTKEGDIVRVLLSPESDGYEPIWFLQADFKSRADDSLYGEFWDVDVLCLRNQVAAWSFPDSAISRAGMTPASKRATMSAASLASSRVPVTSTRTTFETSSKYGWPPNTGRGEFGRDSRRMATRE